MERRSQKPLFKFKMKNDSKRVALATGRFLPVSESGGRKIVFQMEGDAFSWIWVVSFSSTWLAKRDFGRSAERKEDVLVSRAKKIVQAWYQRGLSGDWEIKVYGEEHEGIPKEIPKKRKSDL